MNALCVLLFAINLTCLFISCDTARIQKKQQFIIRGRVTYRQKLTIPTSEGAILTVALEDTSLADAPAKLITQTRYRAVQFPMSFTVTYSPSQVANGHSYSLRATIRNKNNELLYINDVHAGVTVLGDKRTKTIDVPVISVKTPSVSEKQQWPELVGKTGEEAVQIIKRETGFTNVVILKEDAPITLDYRTDRVRVFVNNNGVVVSVPTVG